MKTARMMKAATARSAWWNLHLVLPVVIVALLIGDLGVKEATGHSLYMAIVMGMTFVWIKLWMTVNMGGGRPRRVWLRPRRGAELPGWTTRRVPVRRGARSRRIELERGIAG